MDKHSIRRLTTCTGVAAEPANFFQTFLRTTSSNTPATTAPQPSQKRTADGLLFLDPIVRPARIFVSCESLVLREAAEGQAQHAGHNENQRREFDSIHEIDSWWGCV